MVLRRALRGDVRPGGALARAGHERARPRAYRRPHGRGRARGDAHGRPFAAAPERRGAELRALYPARRARNGRDRGGAVRGDGGRLDSHRDHSRLRSGGEAMITTITIFIPLLGAIVMLLLPEDERPLRYAALGIAAVPLLPTLYLYFAYGRHLGAAPLKL